MVCARPANSLTCRTGKREKLALWLNGHNLQLVTKTVSQHIMHGAQTIYKTKFTRFYPGPELTAVQLILRCIQTASTPRLDLVNEGLVNVRLQPLQILHIFFFFRPERV